LLSLSGINNILDKILSYPVRTQDEKSVIVHQISDVICLNTEVVYTCREWIFLFSHFDIELVISFTQRQRTC